LELFASPAERLASFRRSVRKRWYQHRARNTVADWSFMNYGFESLEQTAQLKRESTDEDDRSCIQLYHHIAGAIDLADQDEAVARCLRNAAIGPRR